MKPESEQDTQVAYEYKFGIPSPEAPYSQVETDYVYQFNTKQIPFDIIGVATVIAAGVAAYNPELRGTPRFVLTALIAMAEPTTRVARLTMGSLTYLSGFCKNAVISALNTLEETGVITSLGVEGKLNGNDLHKYSIDGGLMSLKLKCVSAHRARSNKSSVVTGYKELKEDQELMYSFSVRGSKDD